MMRGVVLGEKDMQLCGVHDRREIGIERDGGLATCDRPFAEVLEPCFRRLHAVQQPVRAIGVRHGGADYWEKATVLSVKGSETAIATEYHERV